MAKRGASGGMRKLPASKGGKPTVAGRKPATSGRMSASARVGGHPFVAGPNGGAENAPGRGRGNSGD